ncbi:macrophage mannose receptor 1 [Pseudoliparis swirei]|uniref:macrophage mannose receptor 1 n=1 Tax=Pseudoliparis swirei TaxID=2059687 RepID=UPI0024BF0D5A|nr:macrophage mannose receptor 1 [Pseudoliparis swirei]
MSLLPGCLGLRRVQRSRSEVSSLALASVCSAAERQYFLQDWSSLMWDEARTHCQVCFKDLVTVTPENIKSITQNLTSDCWVGLRKNFSSAGDTNMSWSRWADGDPLIFQNWYPGWPVLGGEAECVSSIEDSCVAMLSFGAWVEKNCSDLLPFICYEDRFFGRAGVTNITSESAVLTWLPAPGGVGHYRVEVKVDEELKQFQSNSLTYDLVNLTAGTHYSVQVFPVKCTRALDPQEIAFYSNSRFKIQDVLFVTYTHRVCSEMKVAMLSRNVQGQQVHTIYNKKQHNIYSKCVCVCVCA